MSISGVQNSAYVSQLFQTGSRSGAVGNDGDGDGSLLGAKGGTGQLSSSIMQALSRSGISIPAGSAQPTGSQDPQQALQAFMQHLFAALQAQMGQASQAAGSDSDGDNDGSAASRAAGAASGQHGGGVGKMEAGLQGLIQQLSSSGSSSNFADAALQQSFQGLLTAQGGGASNANLTSVLQTVLQNMQGAGVSGGVINTQG